MSELIEILLLGILVCVVAATVRSINRRRADRRSVELTESGSGGFRADFAGNMERGRNRLPMAELRLAQMENGRSLGAGVV